MRPKNQDEVCEFVRKIANGAAFRLERDYDGIDFTQDEAAAAETGLP